MPGSSTSLLIIEDDPWDRQNLRRLLSEIPGRHYSIREAEDASQSARAVREGQPDCILLDCRLPEKDGVRLVEQITQEHGSIPAAIVLLAPLIDRNLSAMALNLGAQDVLSKSGVTAEVLERSIDCAMVRYRLTRERDEALKALAHRENLLRIAQEAAGVGVFDLNLATGETSFSESYFKIYGLPPDHPPLTFDQWIETLHPEDRASIREQTELAIRQCGEFNYEFRVVWPDQSIHWILGRGSAFGNGPGEAVRLAGINMDLTAAKSTEQELATAVADLQQFVYAAGHDLQAPLRSVGVFADVLGEELGSNPNDRIQQALAQIRGGVQKMHTMVSDLMTYAKAGAAHVPELHPVELEEVLKSALENVDSDLRGSGATVTWDTLPAVLSASDELVHVFQNLLANAVKYRRPDVPLSIHVDAAPDPVEDGRTRSVTVAIRDNGQGFPEPYARFIFEPFTRLSGGNAGTGLGLAICKRIVARHGGRIWAEAKPGAGATFFFTLPLASANLSAKAVHSDRTWKADVA